MILQGPRGPRLIQPRTLAMLIVQRAGPVTAAPVVCYVDPTQVSILSTDAGAGDVDPTQVVIVS